MHVDALLQLSSGRPALHYCMQSKCAEIERHVAGSNATCHRHGDELAIGMTVKLPRA